MKSTKLNSITDYGREEDNQVEQQRALATLGRTYFFLADSITDADDEQRKRALNLCRQYYEKSLRICKKYDMIVLVKMRSN